MKQSYCRSGVFHIFRTLGIFLTSFTLLSSCSNELEDFSSDLKEDKVTLTSTKDDSVLRFKTIDELENISVSDIPGDNDGFELRELSYECVDTIELRALRFDVKAKLASSSNQERVISFTAEVGPELVSVEYYPGGEIVPAHDNMMTAYYPKVERYRNYSDGSRIGPDEFYDYGHFVTFFIHLGEGGMPQRSFGLQEISNVIPRWVGNGINPESEWWDKGVFYNHSSYILDYNLNTTVIEANGKTYSGEDLLPKNIIPGIYDPSWYVKEVWLEMVNNNYYEYYRPSREYYTDDPDTFEILNLCHGVEDKSPIPYPTAREDLSYGWYYRPVNDDWDECYGLNSIYFKDIYDNDHKTFDAHYFFYFYSQYLVIDGRIIHFDHLINKDYGGMKNSKLTSRITKDSEGYLAHFEAETSLYGERFKSLLDVQIRANNGPSELIDLSNYFNIDNGDIDELNSINNNFTRSGNENGKERIIINEKHKSYMIDEKLPKAINNVRKFRTIKK